MPPRPLKNDPRPAKPASSRQAALEILLLQDRSRRPLDQVLAEYPARRLPADSRDRQLTLALVYGVLRWRGFLDEVAARHARHPLTKMKPLTLNAIRLGLVQLLFFDRIPPAAAIDETIKALKAARQPGWLTGFVNGLLRAAARQLAELQGEKARGAERLSHPAWLWERWHQRYGEQGALARCRADNQPPNLTLRVNRRRATRELLRGRLLQAGIAVSSGRYAPAALVLPAYHGRIEELPGYAAGLFAVQDEAAQLVSLLLLAGEEAVGVGGNGSEPGQEPGPAAAAYLDACAGLGGKTGHLAEILPAGSRLAALEPEAGRFGLLAANLARLGLTVRSAPPGEAARIQPSSPAEGIVIYPQALAEFARQAVLATDFSPYRGILVDAPCSGLGVIRRHPDIRWNRQAFDLPRYRRQQIELLQTAAGLLAPGGVLVYVVCSNEPEENEEVIAEVLRTRSALALTDARPWLPAAARDLVDEQGFFRSRPELGLDGFFAARLISR